jgi:hypothetical protein
MPMAMIRVVTARSSCSSVLRGPRSGGKQAGGHSRRRPRSIHAEYKGAGSRGIGRVALPGGSFRRGGPADPGWPPTPHHAGSHAPRMWYFFRPGRVGRASRFRR